MPRPRPFPRPAAGLAGVIAAMAAPAAPAHALLVDFETARLEDGRIVAPGLTVRRLEIDAVMTAWTGGPGHGALALEDLGPEGFGGARGLALSTRDLSFPYGLSLEFERAATAVSGLWVAANTRWQGLGYDADGVLRVEFDIAADAGRFAVRAPEGIVRLDLRGTEGWDWLWLDALQLEFGADGAPGEPPPEAMPVVPLPGTLPLLAAVIGGVVGLRALASAMLRDRPAADEIRRG